MWDYEFTPYKYERNDNDIEHFQSCIIDDSILHEDFNSVSRLEMIKRLHAVRYGDGDCEEEC